jgi:hypothetical protein
MGRKRHADGERPPLRPRPRRQRDRIATRYCYYHVSDLPGLAHSTLHLWTFPGARGLTQASPFTRSQNPGCERRGNLTYKLTTAPSG